MSLCPITCLSHVYLLSISCLSHVNVPVLNARTFLEESTYIAAVLMIRKANMFTTNLAIK